MGLNMSHSLWWLAVLALGTMTTQISALLLKPAVSTLRRPVAQSPFLKQIISVSQSNNGLQQRSINAPAPLFATTDVISGRVMTVPTRNVVRTSIVSTSGINPFNAAILRRGFNNNKVETIVVTDPKGRGKTYSERVNSALSLIRLLCRQGLKSSICRNNPADNFDPIAFLEKYGYLNELPPDQLVHNQVSLTNAISEFQIFVGLPATGVMDSPTVRKMNEPRCGVVDVVPPRLRTPALRNYSQSIGFTTPAGKWQTTTLTYRLSGFTGQLSQSEQLATMTRALQRWANQVPLRFRRVETGRAEIDILFANGNHGDGPNNAFDGRGGTLAHAYLPGSSAYAGDVHFDNGEQWTLNSRQGTNLEIVAAHEFGHALGLGHSTDANALMAPYYKGYDPNYGLNQDDIAGIQSLYGRGRGVVDDGTVNPPNPPNSRPNPPPSPPFGPSGPFCNVRFDAITRNADRRLYLFNAQFVYQLDSVGVTSRSLIREVFRGAPSAPDSAVFDGRRLFIFKGGQYWRYSNNQLDPGYPRALLPQFQASTAALQGGSGGLFLFFGDTYRPWGENQQIFVDFQYSVSSFWPSNPRRFDAALRDQDGFYFFLGIRYWKFSNQGQLQPGYPRDTRPAWLSCGTRVPR